MVCGELFSAEPVIASPSLPSSPTIGQKETEKEVTALVSPKDGFPDSAAAAAIVVDGVRGQIFYLVRHIGSKITHFRGKHNLIIKAVQQNMPQKRT